MDNNNANLIEVFSSAQGEGPYLGFRQIFLRFAECNLKCTYCDTDSQPLANINIEQTPGNQDFEPIANPVDVDTLFYYIKRLDNPKGIHHSISLTGGEPLVQADFLKFFLTENFAKYKYKIYLETNGILSDELEKVVKLVDIVSMDIKLPSSTKNPIEHWHEHKRFLEVLNHCKKSKVEHFVKVVVNNDFTDYELYNIVWCIASSESNAALILQPEFNNPPDSVKLLAWQAMLLKHLDNVRIIPQTHKVMPDCTLK